MELSREIHDSLDTTGPRKEARSCLPPPFFGLSVYCLHLSRGLLVLIRTVLSCQRRVARDEEGGLTIAVQYLLPFCNLL